MNQHTVVVELRVRLDDFIAHRALVGSGLVAVLETDRAGAVLGLINEVERAVGSGMSAVGYVAYEAASGFDPALATRSSDRLPLAYFGIFREMEAVEPLGPAKVASDKTWRADIGHAAYAAAVRDVHEAIRAGWTYQVNLTMRFRAEAPAEPFSLYRHLACSQRGAYNAFLEEDRFAICCASPELFFERDARSVRSRPMKGTAPRGRFAEEDQAAAAALLASEKERAENVMILDLIRNDLGRLAEYGSVTVPELFVLERYPTLWQMTSEVHARVPTCTTLGEVFAALFPCGSVTGAPKNSTMEVISRLESSPRGVYCGAVGSLLPGPNGPHARFAVAIRTATVDKTIGTATYGVGGGITIDSNAAAERREATLKAQVLVRSSVPSGLFETFRFERAAGYVNLERHLARLRASAGHFRLDFDEADCRLLLEQRRAVLASRARVRIELGADGRIAVSDGDLPKETDRVVELALDEVPQDERDPFLFHKTTDRRRYDEALARHPGVDDVALVNRRGELTETTRANLALELGGHWLTPALSCGLLPGIERGRLLETGRLREAIVLPSDLKRASAIATFSSLRGWRRARLAPKRQGRVDEGAAE